MKSSQCPQPRADHHLSRDLDQLLLQRRRSLGLIGGASLMPLFSLIGCGGSTDAEASDSSSQTSDTCSVIPEETAGPYPGDGSNSSGGEIANALLLSGIVRSDIRSSIDGASGVAAGVPLTIKLQLVNTSNQCGTLPDYAVYLWHCSREGLYSMYSDGITDENYLRGVQAADALGEVVFTTIFPGCYSGRMPHVHFEIYPSLSRTSSASNKIKTSQLTFPMATLTEVYSQPGYSASVSNLAQISYATDNVFSDGTSLQMCSLSGNATDGYVANLTVAIAA